MMQNYDMMIQEKAERVFSVMEKRVSLEDVERIRAAFELAKIAHADQKRKSGEPYIFHPIAVANIVAEELMLGANPVIAAFLTIRLTIFSSVLAMMSLSWFAS